MVIGKYLPNPQADTAVETPILRHELTVWQAVTGAGPGTYGILANRTSTERMPPSSRATKASVALYRAVGPAGKAGSKLRRASEISLTTPSLDLAARLRVFQRALRSRVERRDAFLDIVRAVNTTLEPPKVADMIV